MVFEGGKGRERKIGDIWISKEPFETGKRKHFEFYISYWSIK